MRLKFLLVSFLLFLASFVSLSSHEMPWRSEPFALLLIKKAKETNRFEEKKAYLDRIALRLGLTLPKEALTRETIATTTESLYSVFYPTTSSTNRNALLSSVRPFFPTIHPIDKNEINVLAELQKQDTLFPSAEPQNWPWIELELECMYLDLIPLTNKLSSPQEKIEAINWYLFFLKEIRYPPLKEAFQQVDHYSSLGEIFSSHQGICLGTTILYTVVCQKMGIPLVIFTPPGHILPGLAVENGFRAIETTARGSHVPLSQYETIEEPIVQPHSLNAIAISSLENKAATCLTKKEFQKALDIYHECEKMEKSGLHTKMIPICLLLLGKQREAKKAAADALSREEKGDYLLADIAQGSLSSSSALKLIETISEENPFHIRTQLPALVEEARRSPNSLALRYHTALLLFQNHQADEAQAMLEAVKEPSVDALHWYLLRLAIAEHKNDRTEEIHYALLLLKQAVKERVFSYDLIWPCFQLYRRNPDCQELGSLLEKMCKHEGNG